MKTQIDLKRLKELERAEAKLNALEQGGVDNWEFYGEALNEFSKNNEIEELIEDLLTDLEVDLLRGAYEPSERGAGYCATDEARNDAYVLIKKFINDLKAI